jgi:hypothetical protein
MKLLEFEELTTAEMDGLEISDWDPMHGIKSDEDIALLLQELLKFNSIKTTVSYLKDIAKFKHNNQVLKLLKSGNQDINYLITQLGFTINGNDIQAKIPTIVSDKLDLIKKPKI